MTGNYSAEAVWLMYERLFAAHRWCHDVKECREDLASLLPAATQANADTGTFCTKTVTILSLLPLSPPLSYLHTQAVHSSRSKHRRAHTHTLSYTQLNLLGQPVPVNLQLYLFQCSWLRAQLPGPPGPGLGHSNPREGRGRLGPERHKRGPTQVCQLPT